MKKKKGFTLIELLVVIAIIAMLLAILMPALGKVKKLAMRLVCATNLKGMANAMNVYAFDYRDEYPIQGGRGSKNFWGVPTAAYWNDTAFPWNNPAVEDQLTVSASLFMLVREADVGVKSFICKASDQKAFVNTTQNDIVELYDFGPGADVKEHQSYSYQMPYGAAWDMPFAADGTSNPGNAVMADRNPWFDPMLSRTPPIPDEWISRVSKITLLGTALKWEKSSIGNAEPHDREGQNVLFNDGHVDFAKAPDVGTRYDNIYTQGVGGSTPEESRRIGTAKFAIGGGVPMNSEDSYLVNDAESKL